jgi:trehalose/maltose hydrolase-like predicted phosphorylase
MDNVKLLSYRHELDIKNAVLWPNLSFRDRAGRETTLETRRFISMSDRHIGAMEWKIVAENWSGTVEAITVPDGRVTNRAQTVHLNPNSGKWYPDMSHNQRHVSAAIFYNRLAVLPGHRRLGVPVRLRRRDDAGDPTLLGQHSPLQRGARTLRDPRRHGA